MSYQPGGLNISHMYAIHAQVSSIDSALGIAHGAMRIAQGIHSNASARERWKMVAYAFLNRACELACVPLAQYYAESSSGNLDLVWVTYRPEAVSTGPRSIPDAMVYLGAVDNLTEDQARARAIGW